ncbi:trimeric intracellular cation channel family protein [Endozoicomonas sp. G2_2]|uniref:trimeric intracellular cation channel family protein n=1 Tax=Endozoicomonas sp. G2_2 TaxID=2821092 RepID=UPI001ADCAFC3|nr:trimeric intracellular cation channel family protein [Endozoicomonas sp. G2_2]MBO9471016.1 trimeric intracellular cation channel family protein [Endozoicomonas sp. G2_2]
MHPTASIAMQLLLSVLELAGTFVFAISGAMAAVQKRLDIFGLAVLAFATGTVGGITRDLLIGATPPLAIADVRYGLTTMAAALVVFFGHRLVDRISRPVAIFDAAGLSLFAVGGSIRALEYGISPVMAAVMGMITGIGGGIMRDVLIDRLPMVLAPTELYATAALLGSTITVTGMTLGWPFVPTVIVAATLCFFLRYMAMRRGWHLPVPRVGDR